MVRHADFGLGVALDRRDIKLKTFCGTFEYAAPEMLGKLGYVDVRTYDRAHASVTDSGMCA